VSDLTTSDFDFELPEANIALRPADPRDSARLMVVRGAEVIEDRRVHDLADLLRPGDALVFNDTRVIPAELKGERRRGEQIVQVVANLHKRAGADAWWAFARPGKRLKPGDRIQFGALTATLVEKAEGGDILLRFDVSGEALDRAIVETGTTPLPPYIAAKRAIDARDIADYQTLYARLDGSVAAPTAGLHFTPDLFARLDARGVEKIFLTLHVGAGTFLPVKADRIVDHKMHAEWGLISQETAERLNAVRARGGRIIAVGTTSLRLLETAAGEDRVIRPFAGETAIFITPGYRFRGVDALMTNFHLPRSTLFMLVSALCGLGTMRAAYARAIAMGYRFYSYGDSSLLIPESTT
jgi:S-adenosylmethionine:tRNA ribosyltransferase-isomerase